jgi:hypothetical protein
MKAKNQIVVISGILALLATATIGAASSIVQPADAQCPTNQPYGRSCVSQEAGPAFGGAVSGLAQGNGLQDFRASGCGANQFAVNVHGANDVC